MKQEEEAEGGNDPVSTVSVAVPCRFVTVTSPIISRHVSAGVNIRKVGINSVVHAYVRLIKTGLKNDSKL